MYYGDVSHPETPVAGGPSRVQVAEVVAINAEDGTIDASPLNGRATKAHIPYPTWWVPQMGERCLIADRDGDSRQPICLGFMAPADGSNAGPQLQGTVGAASLPKASATALGVTKLSVAPASASNPIAVGDNDTRVPTAGEAAALLGTSGTPGSGNKYVTDADSRNTNARTPTAHAASHAAAGSDPITISESQVTSLTADLGLKAPLASPAFTGTVTFGAGNGNLYAPVAGCLKTDSMLAIAGSTPPASGQSLEAGCVPGVAFFQAFDRTAGSAIKLHLQGSEVAFYDAAANQRFNIDGTGVGFFAVPTVARAAAYTQTYATASRTHSNPLAAAVSATGATSTTPFGYTTAAQANAIVTAINNLITDVANVKQVLNSVIDDHQAYGLLQ